MKLLAALEAQEEEDMFNVNINSPSKNVMSLFEEWEPHSISQICFDVEEKHNF